jgi:hypothetical protein
MYKEAAMAEYKDTPRSALSFEEFIEAATAAAVRASARAGQTDPKYHHWPIWVGIIIRPPDHIETIGNPASQ